MAPLKAVTLTHVRYQKGDQLGHFLAWVSLVPVFISLGGFVSHFIFRRELQGLFFCLGLIISQFINEFIKTSVEQARPETCALLETCDSHGWPSSHSQYVFFFSVYFTLMTYKGIGLWSGRKNLIAYLLGLRWELFLGDYGFGWSIPVLYCYFPAIEDSALGRFFYLKDTSHIPNVLKFEYDNARAARKNMDCKWD
ncbi:lipid phosphate phosphatase gamma, chloroplastic [Quillaja saponaria]|uniref:Lipid phosphate phosphatase gamma, chloroplastic n=1 Tax=Quillaja saponaria TaxID=32244 RepID=A0AAD7Q085_QUISA|nr:lipid phosphate phosphatase gamma, chloroplastic [Quillaja saponaria]